MFCRGIIFPPARERIISSITGDEWEHDITVKKVIELDPKEQYPKVLKITGEIPEQYPDYDEEE